MTQTESIIDAAIAVDGLRINRELARLHDRELMIEQLVRITRLPRSSIVSLDDYELAQAYKAIIQELAP